MLITFKKWFTIIELIIAITIFFTIVASTYIPYNHYIKKANLNTAVKDISQSLYNARNMAINWLSWDGSNRSIWIYLDATDKNKIKFYSYPHNFTNISIDTSVYPNIKELKTLVLPEWVQIDNIEDENNWLFLFSAIYWIWTYYYFNASWENVFNLTDDEITIKISYKWSTSSSLTKEIIYFKKTNIVDYN